jgi:threonine dehydrogenase-like Zn-dependent dehydrogenase
MDMTRRGGRCVLGGLPVEPLSMDMQEVVFGEKQVVGALASAWHFGRSLNLISSGRIDPAAKIEKEYRNEDAAKAMHQAHTDTSLCKLMIGHD